MKTNILIEGWRGINHSYAMVNQYQLLEMAARQDIGVFHNDVPFYKPNWDTKNNSNGLDAKKNGIINSFPPPTAEKTDIIYRICFPFRLYGGESKKIFSFGTSEFQNLDGYIYQGPETSASYSNDSVKIITPSNWSKTGFLLNGYKKEDVFVVSHGVNTGICKPADDAQRASDRKALNLQDDQFMFLSVGAMTWNKGMDKLLMAFYEIQKKYPHTHLMLKDQSNLYGIGAWDAISGIIKDHPSLLSETFLSGISVLSSNLTLKQLTSLYNACDAYIAPYRAEGFNLPPLEAAACGVPVAVTSGGSTDDYIHDSFALKIEGKKSSEGNKHYIEPDLDSLISAMSDLIENRTPNINRKEARNYICQNYSWKMITDKLLDILLYR